MHQQKRNKFGLCAFALLAVLALSVGCGGSSGGGGGGGGGDIGDNNPDVVLALGDSITEGRSRPAGAPYPDRLAALSGKAVINAGVSGESSGGGASRVSGLLARHKPAKILILYGANDVIHDVDDATIINNLRVIIQAAKANQTRPIIASLLPMYDSHAVWQPRVEALLPQIRALASAEGAGFVSMSAEFGSNRDLLQPDGLHPSDAGTQVLALAFNDRI